MPEVFLSCSSDWTVKLWHQDRLKPVLSFHSSTVSVAITDSIPIAINLIKASFFLSLNISLIIERGVELHNVIITVVEYLR